MPDRLYIDINEDQLIRTKLEDIGIVTDLVTGDYLWDADDLKRWGIERKELNDFFQSFNVGRLTDQLRRLVDLADYPLLLIEGTVAKTDSGMIRLPRRNGGLAPTNYRWSLYQDLLLEIQFTGVGIQFSTNMGTSAERIRELYNWSNRADHHLLDKRLRTMEYSTRLNAQMQLMTALPGIGPEVARQLLSQFSNPFMAMAAFNQAEQWLSDIKGLGPKKIAQVKKVLFG